MINKNFLLLPTSYLFTEVGRRRRDFENTHPGEKVIRMDIGDVTLPLFPVVANAMTEAIKEMSTPQGFRGYAPEQGYEFLRKAIAEQDYQNRGLNIEAEDIFISDGAKSDLGNLGDILSTDCTVALSDPGYPVYSDTNVMFGRGGNPTDNGRFSRFIYLDASPDNDFIPPLPTTRPDVIILCSPNNPTGTAMTKKDMQKWVDYAREHKSLIIFDSAYEAYVRTPGVIRSIYEINGADECAIEVRSFSKSAGFTGVRCGYTIVPRKLKIKNGLDGEYPLHPLWMRRQTTKFNGIGYIVQAGAHALYTPEGQKEIKRATDLYLSNAALIRAELSKAGFRVWGATDSPYVWATPKEGDSGSMEIFEKLLDECRICTTPGVGFGKNGEGYVRFTGFNTPELTHEAMQRIKSLSSLKE